MQSFYSKSLQKKGSLRRILGIETSCDETGIAVYDEKVGLLAETLYSQIALHNQYGGVVPELASRDHIRKILPLVLETLKKAKTTLAELNGIAYCAGPGLAGALLVGAAFARSLGWALNLPTIGVHHMEAHLLAVMLEENPPTYPFLALLVSGGHTLLVNVQDLGKYELLGESLDDAAGEAFDKTAKLLGLAYPGGPAIAQLAETGQPDRFKFPRPMLDRPGLDFSFSGLKTAVNNVIQSHPNNDQTKADIAHAFQTAIIDTLCKKTQRALKQTHLKRLVIAGGVAANRLLRENLQSIAKKHGATLYYPQTRFCTDNGAMIAYLGYLRLNLGQADQLTIKTVNRYSLENL